MNRILLFEVVPIIVGIGLHVSAAGQDTFSFADSVVVDGAQKQLPYPVGNAMMHRVQRELTLDSLHAFLLTHRDVSIEFALHTYCSRDNYEVESLMNRYERDLKQFLEAQGVASRRYSFVRKGDQDPIFNCPDCDACSQAERMLNYRVVMRVYR